MPNFYKGKLLRETFSYLLRFLSFISFFAFIFLPLLKMKRIEAKNKIIHEDKK